MKILIAIDSFKGSLSSMEAGRATAEGIHRVFPNAECVMRPLADGGEGTVEALSEGLGGTIREVEVTGPMGKPTQAKYALVGKLAVMEMAQAAGITLVPESERNPLIATTYGVGEMILDAIKQGAKEFLIGIGGSATNDAGQGMLKALGDLSTFNFQPSTFKVACDVKNPLCGPNGASAVFGPQKGATPEMVKELDARLRKFAEESGDPGEMPGDGAAGGLGYAFRRFLNAELLPGVELVLKETRLEEVIESADLVITGEGRLDGQTVMGKAPIGVAKLAKKHGKKVIAFCGCTGEGVRAVNDAGIDAYFPILHKVTSLEEALEKSNAAENLTASVEQVFRLLLSSTLNF